MSYPVQITACNDPRIPEGKLFISNFDYPVDILVALHAMHGDKHIVALHDNRTIVIPSSMTTEMIDGVADYCLIAVMREHPDREGRVFRADLMPAMLEALKSNPRATKAQVEQTQTQTQPPTAPKPGVTLDPEMLESARRRAARGELSGAARLLLG